MKRIVFVDDDRNILEALRRMLHGMRREWEMHFFDRGEEAIAFMETTPADVVVSDMRMPGMDGAQLLSIVRERWPHTVRLILSGYSDREMILRSVASTHQFLTKPCDAETLKRTIERSFGLRQLLSSEALRDIFTCLHALPCLPDVHEELVAALSDPQASMEQVGGIIARDVGMSAKILQMVNTPFFGACGHVASPAQAAALLGVETIKNLVVSAQVFSDVRTQGNFSSRGFRDHSMLTAALARTIAAEETRDPIVMDHAFIAGMLHDVGLLLLANNLPDMLDGAIAMSKKEHAPLFRIERGWLGITHAEIGAYLLALWGQPDPIVEAVAYHHTPVPHDDKPQIPLVAVHVGDHLAHEFTDTPVEPPDSPLCEEFLRAAGLTERLPIWREKCRSVFDRIGAASPAGCTSNACGEAMP